MKQKILAFETEIFKLRRFLNADENIQDPTNTQNYNKYGYVFNNPLMYSDPSGEYGIVESMIIAVSAAIIASVGTDYYLNRPVDIGNMFQSVTMAVISAAVSYGVDEVFKVGGEIAKTLGERGTLISKAGAHALTQGSLSYMQGGNFWSGALSAAFSSASNDLLGLATSNIQGNHFLKSDTFALLNGATSGGVGSVLGGGNFWMGAGQGLIVTAFNFLAHKIDNSKYVIAGIYGAGGHGASGNEDLEGLVEGLGGRMFTSSLGGGDDEIIDYLVNGRNEGKKIKIYGHSRGGVAAVRISNKLGDMNITIAEVNWSC